MRWVSCVLLVGCVPGAVPAEVPVRFVPGAAEVSPLAGVDVRLTEAVWTVSDLRLESQAWTAARQTRPVWPMAWLMPAAVAHPGHDHPSAVVGELLGTWTLDLLGQPVEMGLATTLGDPYVSARLHLEEAPALVLVGEALVDGTDVPFSFALAHGEEISGIEVEGGAALEAVPEVLVLSVDLAYALSSIDWRTDPGADGVLTVEDGAVHDGVIAGVVGAPTWRVVPEG